MTEDAKPDWLTELQNSGFAKSIRETCDKLEDAPAEQSGDGWAGSIYGFCPVQGYGRIDNLFWYFRARHDDWRFEVYSKPTERELPGDAFMVWSAEAEYDGDASWMPYSDAWSIIKAGIETGRACNWATPSESKEP